MKAIFFVLLLLISTAAISEELLFEDDFKNPEKSKSSWELSPGWEFADNQLDCLFEKNLVSIAKIRGSDKYSEYSVEFDIKRNNGDIQDSHCGVCLSNNNYIFIREKAILYTDPAKKEEQGIGYFQEKFQRGKWYHFKIICSKKDIKVFVDGRQLLSIPIKTRTKPVEISFRAWQLSASFKNIRIYDLSENKSPLSSASSKNLIMNSGFEFVSQEKLPDYWGTPHWGLNDVKWFTNFEKWRNLWAVTEDNVYDGKKSFRLCYPAPNEYPGNLYSCELDLAPGKNYTISAYFKSQPAGTEVLFAGTKIILTDNWQRYSVPFTCKSKNIYDRMFAVAMLTCGTMWVDNFQMEEGQTLSTYSPSETDLYLGNLKKSPSVPVLPSIKVSKIDNRPILDGKLDDECWKKATRLPLGLLGGNSVKEKTYASVLYDSTGLYIGFSCDEENICNRKTTITTNNGNVWLDPCVEFFAAPEYDLNNYRHFALNCNGIMYSSTKAAPSWNGVWEAKTFKNKDFWTAEIFIPFGNFQIKKLPSEKWRINFCRDNNSKQEYSTWAPLTGSFHKPDSFGIMVLPEFETEKYMVELANPKFKYDKSFPAISLDISNSGNKNKSTTVKAEIKYNDGVIQTVEEKIYLEKNESKNIVLNNIDNKKLNNAAECKIMLFDSDNGSLIKFQDNLQMPPLINAELQYSYYIDDKEALLRIFINAKYKKDPILRIGIANKTILEKNVDSSSNPMYISLPLENLQDGDHKISIQLLNEESNGKTKIIEQVDCSLRKQRLFNATRIDYFRRCLVVNNKPFFPVGIVWDGAISQEVMDNTKKSGFRTLFIHAYDDKNLNNMLEYAEKAGLKIILELSAYDFTKFNETTWQEYKSGKLKLISRYKDFPALLAWDVMDERADSTENPEAFSAFFAYTEELKRIDPYHPLYTNECEGGLRFLTNKKKGWPSDIVSVDYYPMDKSMDKTLEIPFNLNSENIAYTSTMVKMANEIGKTGNKPVFFFLQSCGYAFWAAREPFPAEEEFMTYTTIINGARGIFYFVDHPRSNALWQKMKALNQEIITLEPIIFSIDSASTVETSSDKIQILVKKLEGKTYIITVNSSRDPVDARFAIPGLKASEVEVMFEDRKIKASPETFEDKFEGFQRHVYVIKE